MTVVEQLLQNSEEDRDLLRKNIEKGDDPSIPRDAEFVFYAKNHERAELVCSFVHDNSFGHAICQDVLENPESRRHRIIVSICMPTTDNVLCAVSAMMVFLADMFDLDYDGWGCLLQAKENNNSKSQEGKQVE